MSCFKLFQFSAVLYSPINCKKKLHKFITCKTKHFLKDAFLLKLTYFNLTKINSHKPPTHAPYDLHLCRQKRRRHRRHRLDDSTAAEESSFSYRCVASELPTDAGKPRCQADSISLVDHTWCRVTKQPLARSRHGVKEAVCIRKRS